MICRCALAVASLLLGVPAATVPFTELVVQSGQAPWGKALGDLDGDGYPDAVEAGGNQGANVWWFRWVPGSGFSSSAKYQIGTTGGDDDLQVGDVNGDGALDVVVNGGIFWYQNPRGAGGNPQAAWTRHTIDSGFNGHDLALGDVNGDGKLDVVARREFGPTALYLQGATADTWTKVAMPNAPNGEGTALADINRDGRVDIVGNGYWLEQPSNPVTGTWARHDFASWQNASAAVADINGDGRVDVFLAASEMGVGKLSWFQAPSDPVNGTWTRHDVDTVQDVHRFHLVDVDRDGDRDIVFAEMHQSATKRVGIYSNNGGGASWTLQVLSTQGSHNIAVGDLGNDGDLDILGANWNTGAPDGGALKYWRNDQPGGTLPLDRWTYVQVDNARGGSAFGLNFGDVNGDGRKDIVSGPYAYLNPGGNLSAGWTRVSFPISVDALLVTDVDGDAFGDVIAMGGDGLVRWLEATSASATTWNAVQIGNIAPADHGISTQGYAQGQIVVGGKNEIVLTNGAALLQYFQVPANPAAGNWPKVQISNACREEGIAVGDLDGDGDGDVAGFVAPGGTVLAWWENPGNGSANWARHDLGSTTGLEGDRIAIADINGDGRRDVAAGETNNGSGGNSFHWFEAPANPRAGGWVRRTVASNLGAMNSMDVADLNGDGRPDIVTGEHRGPLRVVVWQNNSNGASWTARPVDQGKESHLGARVADLDGDGDLEIASIAWDTAQYLHLWRNDALSGGPAVPPPAAPSGLTATAASSSQINLAWTDSASNESGFEIDRAPSSSGPWNQIATVGANVTSYGNTGLSPSTAYSYRVRATNAGGDSANSNVAGAVTPAGPPPPPAGTGTGPTGEYFDSQDLTGLVFTRTETMGIDFNWGAGSPDPRVGADTFSVRWTGRIRPRFSETYTFYTTSDDGVRLRVNGQPVINNWTDHGPTENSGTVALTAGQLVDFVLEYYESGGGAVIQASWSSASQPKQVIPASQIHLQDADGDGMADAAESAAGSDPQNGDQDGNGHPDGQDDWDGDGVDNATELANGTSAGTPGGGGGGGGGGSGGGACGATGLEAVLLLGWVVAIRARRRVPRRE